MTARKLRGPALLALVVVIGAFVGIRMVRDRRDLGPTRRGVTRVHVSLDGYSPANIEVRAGTTITWVFDDSVAHDVVGDALHSTAMKHGTYRMRFDRPGRYEYHCSFHPIMRGQVVVIADQ